MNKYKLPFQLKGLSNVANVLIRTNIGKKDLKRNKVRKNNK